MVEPADRNVVDSIWWSIVTLTTVGYGDIFPTTLGGRAIAVGLMVVGIGFVALLTASIAAHFVGHEDDDLIGEIRRIHDRLDNIERLIGKRG